MGEFGFPAHFCISHASRSCLLSGQRSGPVLKTKDRQPHLLFWASLASWRILSSLFPNSPPGLSAASLIAPLTTHTLLTLLSRTFFFFQGLGTPIGTTMAPVGGAPSHLTSAFTSASLLSDTSAEWQASSGSWRDARLNLEPWIQTPSSHTHIHACTQTLKLSISHAIFALFQLY